MAKVALVTGGARRIGKCIVEVLHARGFDVLVHCHDSVKEAERLTLRLNQTRPGSAVWFSADLTSAEGVASLADWVLESSASLDLLVNNASLYFPTPVDEARWEQAQALWLSNAAAPFFLIQRLLGSLRQSRGVVINLADAMVDRAMPGFSLYHMAKSAMVAMTKSLAVELAPEIRVNAVAPGAILWPEGDAAPDVSEQNQLLSRIPAGRLGTAEAIADAVVYLATQAGYVTGEMLRVDGGRSLV
jgi:pteridine reductase